MVSYHEAYLVPMAQYQKGIEIMRDGFRIIPFTDWGRVDELIRLFRTGLGETSRAFWQWKYCEQNGLSVPNFWIIEDQQGTMVGTLGTQPYIYQCGDSEITVVQLQDLVVAPECRGFGFVRVLYHTAMKYYKAKGCSAFVAYSNNASIGPFVKFGSFNMGDIGLIRSNINELAFLKRPIQSRKIRDWSFTVQNTMPNDVFFTDCVSAYKMVKSPSFMRWRFDRNPEEQFHWLEVRSNGELAAWIVFQENHGRARTAVNIYDYDLQPYLPDEIMNQMVTILKTRGSYVSLFGRLVPDDRERWMRAGLKKELPPPDAHFLLHFFDGSIPPRDWQILRCDRDF